MTRNVAPLIAALAAAGVALSAGPAAAEINPGQQEGLGLSARDVPAILQQARANPYQPVSCEAAFNEVAQLDQVLGPDADEPEVQANAAGNLLMKGARSLIPYREVFRVVTGVDRKERALADAAMAGWARRGFLKAQLHGQCSEPEATIAATAPAARETTDVAAQDVAIEQPAPEAQTIVTAQAPASPLPPATTVDVEN